MYFRKIGNKHALPKKGVFDRPYSKTERNKINSETRGHFCGPKSDVTQDDSQRRLLAQHSDTMLEQCSKAFEAMSQQCCDAVLR